jgi:hypothetical protein
MTALLVAVIVLLFASAYVRERQNARFIRDREDEWRLERTALLQRIQAPEVAVVEAAKKDTPAPPSIAYDSDEEYWRAKEAVRRNGDGD